MKNQIAPLLFILAMLATSGTVSGATLTKASDWLGHVVVTRDGDQLGTVRDFAIDSNNDTVLYVVVSVGSFLIENNLIAVAPDALVPAADEGVLLLDADAAQLRNVKRFASDGRWPGAADVVASEPAEGAAPESVGVVEKQAPPPTGTATIESRSRSAHLSANERVITENAPPAVPVESATTGEAALEPASAVTTTSRPPPLTQFDKLDKDGDGVLNRSEFAHQMSPNDSYSQIDANANGVIDPAEFDAYKASNETDD